MSIEQPHSSITRQLLSLNEENVLAILKYEAQIRRWIDLGRKFKLLTAGPVPPDFEIRYLNIQAGEALAFLINFFETVKKPEQLSHLEEKMNDVKKEASWTRYEIFWQAFLEAYLWALKQKIANTKDSQIKVNLKLALYDAEQDRKTFLSSIQEDRSNMKYSDRIAMAIKDIPGPRPLLLPRWVAIANSCLTEPDENNLAAYDRKLGAVLENMSSLLANIEITKEASFPTTKKTQKSIFKIMG